MAYRVTDEDVFGPACNSVTLTTGTVITDNNIAIVAPEATGTVSGQIEIEEAEEDDSVTLSFRQAADCGNGEEQIEVRSINVGGDYDEDTLAVHGSYGPVTLPTGIYTVVASVEGRTSVEVPDVEITNVDAPPELDAIVFPIE